MPIERDLTAPTADEVDKEVAAFVAEYTPPKLY
jgi:hypothetical protein